MSKFDVPGANQEQDTDLSAPAVPLTSDPMTATFDPEFSPDGTAERPIRGTAGCYFFDWR